MIGKMWVELQTNRALQNDEAVRYAWQATEYSQLPLHPDRCKNWDNLIAIHHVLANVNKTAPILDAGAERVAGWGSVFLPSLKQLGYTNLAGCNLNEMEDETVDGIRYCHGNIEGTGFPADYFAFVACLSVVEHGADWRDFLYEMKRIIRPRGYLFVSTDYWETLVDTGKPPWHIFTKEEIKAFISCAKILGLEPVKEIDLSCKDKVIHSSGLEYTFINMLFQKKVL